MSITIGGVDVSDITLDGTTVDEVWVNHIKVFDAYNPANIPDGENKTTNRTATGRWDENSIWWPEFQSEDVYATGSMSCKLTGYTASGMSSEDAASGMMFDTTLAMYRPGDNDAIAWVCARSVTGSNYNYVKRRSAYIKGVGEIIIQSGSGEMNTYATLQWDFKNATAKINGNTYSFTHRWKDGIYFKYNITAFGYNDSSYNWKTAVISTAYQLIH